MFAVATSEVSCYNVIVRLRSLPRFEETTRQDSCSVAKRPVASEEACVCVRVCVCVFVYVYVCVSITTSS